MVVSGFLKVSMDHIYCTGTVRGPPRPVFGRGSGHLSRQHRTEHEQWRLKRRNIQSYMPCDNFSLEENCTAEPGIEPETS